MYIYLILFNNIYILYIVYYIYLLFFGYFFSCKLYKAVINKHYTYETYFSISALCNCFVLAETFCDKVMPTI